MKEDKSEVIGIDSETAKSLEVCGQNLLEHAQEHWLDIDCMKCGHGCYWEPSDFQNYQCSQCGDKTLYKLNTRTQ